jgi:hypothetical protein
MKRRQRREEEARFVVRLVQGEDDDRCQRNHEPGERHAGRARRCAPCRQRQRQQRHKADEPEPEHWRRRRSETEHAQHIRQDEERVGRLFGECPDCQTLPTSPDKQKEEPGESQVQGNPQQQRIASQNQRTRKRRRCHKCYHEVMSRKGCQCRETVEYPPHPA